MKQKDIALIAVIVFFSAVVSFLVSGTIFSSPNNRQQEVEVVQPIGAGFPTPDPAYFNNKAFDPTRQIKIGQGSNPDPFSGQ